LNSDARAPEIKPLAIGTAALSEREVEYFVRIVEDSLEVRRRNHFFLWAQGALQALLPHAAMMCAMADGDAPAFRVERFSGEPGWDAPLAALGSPGGGLLQWTMNDWHEAGGRPVLACPRLNGFGWRRFGETLGRHGLPNLAAHGMFDAAGEVASYFIFVGLPDALSRRHAVLLELLVPYLHQSLTRIVVQEKRDGGLARALAKPLTTREVEILQCIRCGKSNAAIAASLGVSPLTVKNHVQNILKKLGARNRAQAVAFGIASRIIPSDQPPG
jgi:transcriptional regulator EpsA